MEQTLSRHPHGPLSLKLLLFSVQICPYKVLCDKAILGVASEVPSLIPAIHDALARAAYLGPFT